MKAAHITGRGTVTITDVEPPVARPGYTILRPLMVAICGSDLRKVYHLPESDYPLPPGVSGHEIIGVVEEIGPPGAGAKRDNITVGETVLGLIPVIENGMSEYFITASDNVLSLPGTGNGLDRRDLERLLMAQQLGTVIYACKRIGPVIGRTAAVIGQGSAGLFFNAMLKRPGADRVVAMDIVDARIDAGIRFGADFAFHSLSDDPVAFVSSVTGGAMADLVIEAVGEPETINLAAHLVAEGGELLYFGVPHEPTFHFDFQALYRAYCRTTSTGSSGLEPGKASFREALKLIASGAIDVSGMVTHRYPFNQVGSAYRRAHDRSGGAIKVLVEMPGLSPLD